MDGPLPIGYYILFFVIQGLIFLSIAIAIDHWRQQSYRKRGGRDGQLPPQLEVHEDVTNHANEVLNGGRNALENGEDDSYQIKCVDICKTYPGSDVMAVCKNTFGVRKGEVFGLLGPNGAGKSTTFSMVAMQIPVTSGSAEVLGHEVQGYPLKELGKFIGQCNQENLLWEKLTVNESLDYVASIKGIEGQSLERIKRLLLETLELKEFVNTKAGNLSGGNKRKLCCAQSLIMCPRIEYLDEPTTGVDPVSRRALVRMIKKMKESSVLLTTHRMDEAETLCDKIAIMINGRFTVLGTPSYLKAQYGLGYSITITQSALKYTEPSTNIIGVMRAQIPYAELTYNEARNIQEQIAFNNSVDSNKNEQDQVQENYEFRFKIDGINQDGSEVTLSDTFARLARLMESETIIDFSLTRTNLEQVFINFAQFQIQAAADGHRLSMRRQTGDQQA